MNPEATSKSTAPLVSTEVQNYFEQPLLVGKPNSADCDSYISAVREVFARERFTNNGFYVQRFEALLQEYLGVRHCIPVCNATSGIELLLRAMELEGEVIVPAFTFVATPHAVLWSNLTPVFCDIDPHTHVVDPRAVERCITDKTSAILAVHLWGTACDTEALEQIAARHNLVVIYDAAHAFACSHQGKMVGNFGSAEVFSFHATKFFHTFEGGAIATNDDALAKRVRLYKNFGFDGVDSVVSHGTNAKMTELSAAFGVTMFDTIEGLVKHNYENYLAYKEAFCDIPGIRIYTHTAASSHNYQYVVLEVDTSKAGFSRDSLVHYLAQYNVFARRYFYPGCHKMEPYCSEHSATPLLLPATERLCERVMCMPTGSGVTPEDIHAIAQLVRTFQG